MKSLQRGKAEAQISRINSQTGKKLGEKFLLQNFSSPKRFESEGMFVKTEIIVS